MQIQQEFFSDNGRSALPIVPQQSDDPLAGYALQLLARRIPELPLDTVLLEMEALAEREQIPIIGPLEGAIIQALLQMRHPAPRCVLDIGTSIGYSALWLARGLPAESKVVSIEIDPQRVRLARKFVEKAGYQHQIEIIEGDVMELLPTLGMFELILQDVIKHVYFGKSAQLSLQLLAYCLEHLVDGGVLLGDNAFCMGEVLLEDADELPVQVLGIKAYNDLVATHRQLDSVILPVRDGLWLSHKRG